MWISVGVQDRNGSPVSGAETIFRVEEGGGTVNPASVITNEQGWAGTTWTLGTAGDQALSVTAGEASARLTVDLCQPIILDPGPAHWGAPRRRGPRIGCGLSVEVPEAGAYYRFTLVGTAEGRGPNEEVALSVEVEGASAGARRDRRVFASRGLDIAPAVADPHPGRRERDQRILSWIARPDGPEPLPDLRGTLSAQRQDPAAAARVHTGESGLASGQLHGGRESHGVLLAHNDHIAIYADETLSPPVSPSNAQVIADLYEDFGVPTIDEYFGGVGDIDGNGRILVYFESLAARRVAAVVWLGDFLSKEDCPASNEAELIRVDERWIRPSLNINTPGVIVHEAKHVSSVPQRILRARADGRDPWALGYPPWWEEGTAEVATEIFSRLAWETVGGPPPGAMVGTSDVTREHFKTREAWSLKEVMDRYGLVMVAQPHSLKASDPYGAGWGFFRFLGDWFGGAGSSRLGDAEMFARLNDASVPVGVDGVQEVTGRTFAELMIDYAQAVSLSGTGAPEIAGVPRFSTYDMTMMNRLPFNTFFLSDGRYPYPVAITGSGPDAQLWLPLAEATTISGLDRPQRGQGPRLPRGARG